MLSSMVPFARQVQTVLQRLALVVFGAIALGMVIATVLAIFGRLEWLNVPMTWDGAPIPNAGMYLQITLTLMAVALCAFLPTNARVLALETSHRRFAVGMDDVAHAYQTVHRADRTGTFSMSTEFEQMKDRLAYLTQHPDLGDLEPPLLELAAQMSFMSKELAEVYSEENVERARLFLRQRQQEVAKFKDRLTHAKAISDELKHWLHEVKMEEQLAASQLDRLCEELMEALPELGMDPNPQPREPKLVELKAQRP